MAFPAWLGPMFNGTDMPAAPGTQGTVRAWMNPGMDAPVLEVRTPIPDLRAHMEHHGAFRLSIAGEYDNLEFLTPCADIITEVYAANLIARDWSALASLKALRALYSPSNEADPLLPSLERLRHLSLYGQHNLSALTGCRALRELSLGVHIDGMFPGQSPAKSLIDLPALPQLESLYVSGNGLETLAGIERLSALRNLHLVRVWLQDTAGSEFLAERFGFTDIQSLVSKKAKSLRDAPNLRLSSDRFEFERLPKVADSKPAVSRDHPTCVVLLVDRSRSTLQPVGTDGRVVGKPDAKKISDRFGKGPDGDMRHCEIWTGGINRFMDRFCSRVPDGARSDVHIGLIEYGARVGWAWEGALAGRTIVPIAEVDANPLRSTPTRTWLEPRATGPTPLGEAMALAHSAIANWLTEHPGALPPIVVNVGSGKQTGDEVHRHGWGIRRLATPLGPSLLFHIIREEMYGTPRFGVEGYLFSEREELFAQASPLPGHIEDAARAAGYLFLGKARGHFDGAHDADVENLLHIFTAVPGLAWGADLIKHPLPPYQISGEDLKSSPWTAPGAPRKPPPFKVPKVKGPMTEALFWSLIDKGRKGLEQDGDLPDRLLMMLEQLSEKDHAKFQRILIEKIDSAYRWDLWAVAFIAKGGCSDDGFEYFRAWLVAQGKKYFDAAFEKPANAAKRIEPGDEAELEALLSVGYDAYETKTGKHLELDLKRPKDVAGESWEEEDLPRLYPKLVKKYE